MYLKYVGSTSNASEDVNETNVNLLYIKSPDELLNLLIIDRKCPSPPYDAIDNAMHIKDLNAEILNITCTLTTEIISHNLLIFPC